MGKGEGKIPLERPKCRWKIILKWTFKKTMMRRHRLDWPGSGWG